LTAFVYQKIASYADSRPHLNELSLADPDPFSSHPIHLLIGADLYGALLLHEIKQGPIGTPTAQRTALGWIISGPTGAVDFVARPVHLVNCTLNPPIDSLLQKFWEIEEIHVEPQLSEEDQRCEQHFVETHKRAADGRYIVRLPLT